MAILVTGGAGFIGSHTCVELLNAGYEVVVLDNFSNSSPEALKRVEEITNKQFRTYSVDLLDRNAVEQVFSEQKIDAVIHFAGLKAVGESVAHPLKYYHNNVTGTIILCETMQKFNVHRIVFSSSATVYGLQDSVPFTESLPLAPINPYGRTKHMIEEILEDVHQADDRWSIALLRYFNPVGAHASGRIGEDPIGPPNNLFPYIAQVAAGRRPELSVFGNDYETPDGTGIRDYIHVVDLADGHVRALERVMNVPGVHTYNLGTGTGYSVLEVIEAFKTACGVDVPYRVAPRRPGDSAVSFGNPTKAKQELNWTPERDLHQMCVDLWRWQSKNPYGFNTPKDVSVNSTHEL